jgi:hypothetical protein
MKGRLLALHRSDGFDQTPQKSACGMGGRIRDGAGEGKGGRTATGGVAEQTKGGRRRFVTSA